MLESKSRKNKQKQKPLTLLVFFQNALSQEQTRGALSHSLLVCLVSVSAFFLCSKICGITTYKPCTPQFPEQSESECGW